MESCVLTRWFMVYGHAPHETANVKLVGHANARQKIQLHRKLKEELTDMQRRCKARTTHRETDR